MDQADSLASQDTFPESPTLPAVINGASECTVPRAMRSEQADTNGYHNDAIPSTTLPPTSSLGIDRLEKLDPSPTISGTSTFNARTYEDSLNNVGTSSATSATSPTATRQTPYLSDSGTYSPTTSLNRPPTSTAVTAVSASTASPAISVTRPNHSPSPGTTANSTNLSVEKVSTKVGSSSSARSSPQSASFPRKHRDREHEHRRERRHEPKGPPPPPNVPPAPAPAMYWSRASTHSKSHVKGLRAHTVNMVGEIMFVFGGMDMRTCFNTLYIFDADTMYWSRPKVIGDIPPACRAHTSTLADKKLYIFGGGDGPAYFNDLYIFDTVLLKWTKPLARGTPPSPRRAHTAALYNNLIYIFGGGDGVKALNDLYTLDVSSPSNLTWQRIETGGQLPISRGYHTSNIVGGKLIVLGGSDGHECFSNMYILDLQDKIWVQVEVETSFPRLAHTSTQVGSYLFVIGGHDGQKYSHEVLLLNLVTMQWEARKVYGAPPSGRGYHSAVLYDSRLFVFGGYDGHSVFEDVYILDLSACAYLPQITNFRIDV